MAITPVLLKCQKKYRLNYKDILLSLPNDIASFLRFGKKWLQKCCHAEIKI